MITATGVTKKFDGFTALDNVSFTIKDGSIFGLVGSNGSGKSTLLRLIAGVLKADNGVIGVDGVKSFDNPYVKSKIAFLGDTPYFFNQSTLKEMAKFYASLYESFDYNAYKNMLKIFPLDENKKISSFSKGMQRQASLILAISTRPKYLLMDEAFDGLDVVMRRTLANILSLAIEESNLTVVIASHNLKELEDIADHIALIHNGKLLRTGEISNLCNDMHKIQAVFTNVPETEIFGELNTLKIERSGSVVTLVVRGDKEKIEKFIGGLSPVFYECIEPTLEEIFIYEMEGNGYDVKNIIE